MFARYGHDLSDTALLKVLPLDCRGRLSVAARMGQQYGHGAGGQP